jgi:probable F420-dependent oxidoreductase
MKVRIGVGTQDAGASGDELAALGTVLERVGFDSIWLPDVMILPVDDPLVGLSYLAGRVGRLKLGTTLVLPGQSPVRLARQLATLDRLSGGRLLVTMVAGIRRRRELEAMGVAAEDRAGEMDELLPLLRRLWSEDEVDHDGPRWTLRGARVEPKPAPGLDRLLWVGGTADAALQRAGELSEGWLPSLCTPAEAAAGRRTIEEHAARAGRVVDPEHFGVSIGYLRSPAPARLAERLVARRRGMAPADPAELVPESPIALRALLERFVDAGFSKFVVRPLARSAPWPAELDALAQAVLDLQH